MQILEGTPRAKAAIWDYTDAEARRNGEQPGLETQLVHSVNYEC